MSDKEVEFCISRELRESLRENGLNESVLYSLPGGWGICLAGNITQEAVRQIMSAGGPSLRNIKIICNKIITQLDFSQTLHLETKYGIVIDSCCALVSIIGLSKVKGDALGLSVRNCTNLQELNISGMKSLQVLKVEDCPTVEITLSCNDSLTSMTLENVKYQKLDLGDTSICGHLGSMNVGPIEYKISDLTTEDQLMLDYDLEKLMGETDGTYSVSYPVFYELRDNENEYASLLTVPAQVFDHFQLLVADDDGTSMELRVEVGDSVLV